MGSAVHTLQVAGPPGAVFRVTDGASRCVATGMHRLEVELPRGLYTVSALMGRSIESREVLLDAPQAVDLQSPHKSFGDRAFALAPQVLAAIGAWRFLPGGQFIALRGPWRDEAAAGDGVSLDRDGLALAAGRSGFVPDPQGQGLWRWQLFDLAAPAGSAAAAGAGVLSVTRSVCSAGEPMPLPAHGDALPPQEASPPIAASAPPPEGPAGLATLAPEPPLPCLPPKVCHLLPHWGDWVVWAAYPATARGAAKPQTLPPAHYVRLRLSRPGRPPPAALQSLHDQVFTALGARTALPLTAPVLDLLLADGADPLLAVAAAHVGSITLGTLGRWPPLPHDAATSVRAASSSNDDARTGLHLIDAEALQQRFQVWLAQHGSGPLAACPDVVAARYLFGIMTAARLRVPPVLLRSLDGLIAAAASPAARAAGTRFDDSVWGSRLQISDAFAFVQWDPDIDYAQALLGNVQRSLASVQESVRFIEEAKSQAAQQTLAEQAPPAAPSALPSPSTLTPPRQPARRAAVRRGAMPTPPTPPNLPTVMEAQPLQQAAPALPALDIDAFIKSNVTSLRIPASAMRHLGSVLSNLSIDQDEVARTLQQMAGRQPE